MITDADHPAKSPVLASPPQVKQAMGILVAYTPR
jgi:hypothetical protein